MTKRCPRCRRTFEQAGQFCPDDGAPLSAGTSLDPAIAAALADDYRVLDWLGSGGMGTVFLAEQIRVGNRKVALKVLHRRFSEDEEFITRFQNEAASTGRINHPNVITIYESKQAPDGTLYIAMELVEGESLTEHLRQRGRLPLDEVEQILSQCCKALQAAHRLGIIHRDIKPDNIMLTRDIDGGVLVKILDFGIAKLKDSSGHTVTGSVLGTPAYMSYEQASGLSSEKLDGRSDIYSLGIVTYTMLAGHPPFRSDTPVGYITKHLTEMPAPLRDVRPDAPAAVDLAVMRALDKDREKRFQTAAEFATAFRDGAKPPAAAPASPPAGTPTPVPPWRARPAAGQTTEVGLASTPAGAAGRMRTPTREAPTLVPGMATPPASPVTLPPVPRPADPVTPAAMAPPSLTPPRVATPPERGPAAPRNPPAVTPPLVSRPPRRRPAVAAEASVPPGPAAPAGGGEGVAAALWGVRTLLSWGMTLYALVFLAIFAWPALAPLVSASFLFPVLAIGQPVVQQVGQWLPPVQVWGWDPLPLVLGVALLIVRPRVATSIWRLEARYRARAAMHGAAG